MVRPQRMLRQQPRKLQRRDPRRLSSFGSMKVGRAFEGWLAGIRMLAPSFPCKPVRHPGGVSDETALFRPHALLTLAVLNDHGSRWFTAAVAGMEGRGRFPGGRE